MTLVKSSAFFPIVDNDKQVFPCDIARLSYLTFRLHRCVNVSFMECFIVCCPPTSVQSAKMGGASDSSNMLQNAINTFLWNAFTRLSHPDLCAVQGPLPILQTVVVA